MTIIAKTVTTTILFTYLISYSCNGRNLNTFDGIETQNNSLGICNGHDTKWNEFPYMASIRHTNSKGHCCGATILNMEKGLLLTAAHCTCSNTEIIYIGCDYREAADCTPDITTQEYRIASFTQMPGYNDPRYNLDVAIIQLTTPISRFNSPPLDEIKEILLDPNEPHNNKPLVIVGYGRIAGIDPNNKPHYLQYGNISAVSRNICDAELPVGHSEITSAMICGRGFNEEVGYGITTCSGDSGGPWFSNEETGLQVGITSWGYNNCANSNCQCCVGYPRMAANIADSVVYSWIHTQVVQLPIPSS